MTLALILCICVFPSPWVSSGAARIWMQAAGQESPPAQSPEPRSEPSPSNTGSAQDVCMPAPLLLWAIAMEKQLSYEPALFPQLRRIALSTSNRTFAFASTSVLRRTKIQYNSSELTQARASLQKLSKEEIRRQIIADESELHNFYSHRKLLTCLPTHGWTAFSKHSLRMKRSHN